MSPHPFRLPHTSNKYPHDKIKTTYQEAIRWVWSECHSQMWIPQVFGNVLESRFTWDRWSRDHANMYPNLVVSENGFLKDICFSHRDSLYCSLSSSPLPQCICIHLLSCCWAAHPREHRPASFDTSRFQRTSSLFFSRSSLKISLFFNTQAHTYDFCPFTSCCRTEKPNWLSPGPVKIRGFFTSMLKHWHKSKKTKESKILEGWRCHKKSAV